LANWFGSSHTLFSLGTLLGTFGAFGPGAFAPPTLDVGLPGNPDPFSLTQILTIHSTGSLLYSGDGSITPRALPEPGTLLLIGAGLLGLIGRRWRHARG